MFEMELFLTLKLYLHKTGILSMGQKDLFTQSVGAVENMNYTSAEE